MIKNKNNNSSTTAVQTENKRTQDNNSSSSSSRSSSRSSSSGSSSNILLYFTRIFIHSLAALHHWYAIYYFIQYVNIPETVHRMGNNFGGKFKYLTCLNLIIQAIYFTISFLNDLIGSNAIVSNEKQPKIRILKDYLFATLAYPINIDVGVIFWILYLINRELVLPKAFDPYCPGWLNHMMHTNILFFIMLEFYISFRLYPKRSNGLSTLIVFILGYLIWVHIIKYYSGFWVYPVLDVFNFEQRIIFFSSLITWTIFVYFTGEFINNRIWSKEIHQLLRFTSTARKTNCRKTDE